MSPRKLYSVSNDEVYFGQSACLSSWAGVVDNEFSISEKDIAEFVRGSNPQLYARLHGLPLKSSSLKDDEALVPVRIDLSSVHAQTSPSASMTKKRPAALVFPPTPPFHLDQIPEVGFVLDGSRDAVLMVVDSVVIGDFTFTLHHHHDNRVICCSYPACRLKFHVIPKTSSFVGVRINICEGNETNPLVDFYCIDCLEHNLKIHVDAVLGLENTAHEVAASLDGTLNQEDVVQAAERLHPALKDKELWKMYYPTEPPLEAGDGSNSKKGLRLRRQKQYEIKRILQKVRRDECTMACSPDTVKPGSLVLIRPRNLPPYGDRYKKQGREWNDRNNHEKTPINSRVIDQPILNDNVSCYCCEPGDRVSMVKCSSDKCMFGLIHLRCTHLKQMPSEEDQFVCQYCQSEVRANGKKAIGPRESIQDRTWADMTPSDADNEESEAELVETTLITNKDDEDMEYHGYDSSDDCTTSDSGFVAVNNVSRWYEILPERGMSVSDEDASTAKEGLPAIA